MDELRGWIVEREHGLSWCYDQEKGPAMNEYLKNKDFANQQDVCVILQSEDQKKQTTLAARVINYHNGLDLCYLITKTNPQKALAEAQFQDGELFTARVERA